MPQFDEDKKAKPEVGSDVAASAQLEELTAQIAASVNSISRTVRQLDNQLNGPSPVGEERAQRDCDGIIGGLRDCHDTSREIEYRLQTLVSDSKLTTVD